MRHDKLERELDMMLMLTGNRTHTIEQVCERLSISRRNFYYYIEFFRDCGFIVDKVNGCYTIDRNSPFTRSCSTACRSPRKRPSSCSGW